METLEDRFASPNRVGDATATKIHVQRAIEIDFAGTVQTKFAR